MHAEHTAEHDSGHGSEHVEQKYPTTIGKIVMLLAVVGGFMASKMLITDHHWPAWAVMLCFATVGILIGGSSTLAVEEKGGRAATYVGFVLVAIGLLNMFNVWIFHAAGK